MTIVERFAKYEHLFRPAIAKMPHGFAVWFFSNGRKAFLNMLVDDKPDERVALNPDARKTLWDISFNNSLMNAAGMFKNGDGYYMAARQKAGAYLAGTTTALARTGNKRNNIKHPVMPLIKWGTAVNWMGLPNIGHELVAFRLLKIDKIKGCPLGISISADPHNHGLESLNGVLSGLNLYDKANVDFIELNESCPNVEHEKSSESVNGLDKKMIERLEFVSEKFLKKRNRNLPVIVKYSVDTDPVLIPALIDLLITLKFDGANFGNTSTDYNYFMNDIDKTEQSLFNYFTSTFGGGVSGNLLKSKSFALSSLAVNIAATLNPSQEFHIIRTGGISGGQDIEVSSQSGISLNQWFTGYFEMFAKHGHKLYSFIFNKD